MAIIVPKGTVVNIRKFGVTHFLRIPFATTQSTPALLDLCTRLAQDPIAANIPRAAWCAPDELHWNVTPLSLKTHTRIEKAKRLLRKLDMDRLTKAIDLSPNAPAIVLRGLCTRHGHDLSNTKEMSCHISEDKPFLVPFASQIAQIFQDANLISFVQDQQGPLTTRLGHTEYLRTQILNDKVTMGMAGSYRSPGLDLSRLYMEYKDSIWTPQYPLHRLCISEIELKDVWRDGQFIKTGYRDIACVPLPGNHAENVTTDVYIKAAKSMKKNFPVCAPVIPPAETL